MAVFYSFELLKTINPKLRTFIKFVEMDLQFLDVSLLKCKIWFKHGACLLLSTVVLLKVAEFRAELRTFLNPEVKTAIYI